MIEVDVNCVKKLVTDGVARHLGEETADLPVEVQEIPLADGAPVNSEAMFDQRFFERLRSPLACTPSDPYNLITFEAFAKWVQRFDTVHQDSVSLGFSEKRRHAAVSASSGSRFKSISRSAFPGRWNGPLK
jgi:hypothetical protein